MDTNTDHFTLLALCSNNSLKTDNCMTAIPTQRAVNHNSEYAVIHLSVFVLALLSLFFSSSMFFNLVKCFCYTSLLTFSSTSLKGQEQEVASDNIG